MNEGAAVRQRELPERIERLAAKVDNLNKLTSELAVRLEGVCTPIQPEKSTAPSINATTPLGKELTGYIDKIQAINELLENLLSRLEV